MRYSPLLLAVWASLSANALASELCGPSLLEPIQEERIHYYLPMPVASGLDNSRGMLPIRLVKYSHRAVFRTDYYSLETPYHSKVLETLDGRGELRLEIERYLDFTYQRYLATKLITEEEIKDLRQIDHGLEPHRVTYIIVSDLSGEPLFTLRIYDGSPLVISPPTWNKNAQSFARLEGDTGKMPLERSHPDLKLPPGEFRIEVGRAAKQPEFAADLHQMFQLVVDYFGFADNNKSLVIYAEAVESSLEWYVKEHGFTVIAGTEVPRLPESYQIPPDFQILKAAPNQKKPRYIMRISYDRLFQINPAGARSLR